MFKKYRKTAVAEINTDHTYKNDNGEPCYIARDPNNHRDEYLIPVEFFEKNYESVHKQAQDRYAEFN